MKFLSDAQLACVSGRPMPPPHRNDRRHGGTAAQASEQVHDERTQDGVGRHHDRTGHARPLRRCAVILGAIARFLSGVAANKRAASLPEPAPEPFLRLRHAQTCEILSSRCERWGPSGSGPDAPPRMVHARLARRSLDARRSPSVSVRGPTSACGRPGGSRRRDPAAFRVPNQKDQREAAPCGHGGRDELAAPASKGGRHLASGTAASTPGHTAWRTALGGVGPYPGYLHVDTGRPRH